MVIFCCIPHLRMFLQTTTLLDGLRLSVYYFKYFLFLKKKVLNMYEARFLVVACSKSSTVGCEITNVDPGSTPLCSFFEVVSVTG